MMSERHVGVVSSWPKFHANLHANGLASGQLLIAELHVLNAHGAVLPSRQLAHRLGNGGLYFHCA